MKSKFAAFSLLFLSVFVLASCLNSDDNYTYTDDSAITSFSISAAKQRLHVKSSTGGDSIVTKDITPTAYKFYIDQVNRQIYNPDSLPYGTDASKLLCSVSSRNSGTVVIKNTDSDTLKFVSTTDSLDFSVDRELQVYSNSGQAVRKYTVRVNVHREAPDSFAWHALPICDELKALNGVRAVSTDGGVLVFGSNGTSTLVFRAGDNGWTACTPDFNHALAADASRSAVAKDGRAFVASGGEILSTADGDHWTSHATATSITRLVAASRFRIYGYAADGRLMQSADDGATWTAATIDEDAALLPTDETASVTLAVESNRLTDRVLLIGTRPQATYPDDSTLQIWSKIDEGAEHSENQTWAFYDVDANNRYKAPRLSRLSAVAYDGAVFVLGTKGDAAPAFYKTRDNGITWRPDTTIALPADFAEGIAEGSKYQAFTLTVNADNVLWLVNARSGRAWRGRINRLGWKKEQTDFTE